MSDVIVCKQCNGKFSWRESMGGYPGGKDRENVDYPYCGETDHSVMISGIVVVEKVED